MSSRIDQSFKLASAASLPNCTFVEVLEQWACPGDSK